MNIKYGYLAYGVEVNPTLTYINKIEWQDAQLPLCHNKARRAVIYPSMVKPLEIYKFK